MQIVNAMLAKVFGLILSPLKAVDPFWSLCLISFPLGILLLLVFRHTSNQEQIGRSREMIRGYLLEMRLFKDNPRILVSSFGNVLLWNLGYMRHAARPLLVMAVPVAFILIHLDVWYGYKPLRPGESAILSVKIDRKGEFPERVAVYPGRGVTIETPPLRILRDGEIDWRVKGLEPGEHSVTVDIGGMAFEKSITVSDGFGRVSVRRTGRGFPDEILHPLEKPIGRGDPVKEISVGYPEREIGPFGWKLDWIVVFLAVTIVAGFSFKGVFKVEI